MLQLIKFFLLVFTLLLTGNTYAQTEDLIVIAPGNTVDLSAESSNATSYVWFHNGTDIPGAHSHQLEASAEGFYAVISYNEFGCPSSISNEIEIRFYVPPPLAEKEYIFCLPKKVYPHSVNIIGEQLRWYAQEHPETALSANEELTTGYYLITQTIGGMESEPIVVHIQRVNCQDLLSVSKSVDDKKPAVHSEIIFSIQVKNLVNEPIYDIKLKENFPSGFTYKAHELDQGLFQPNTGIWSVPVLNPYEETELSIRASVNEDGQYINTVQITESSPTDYVLNNNSAQLELYPTCLKVYNEFSPNEDGKNDRFVIDCIEKYPHNNLQVFNRSGRLVYQQKGYQNQWSGIANQPNNLVQQGTLLPVGTYFYVLSLAADKKPLKGWLYIAH